MTDHISQLIPDPKNARRHNPRNVGMLVDALHEVGAARSIVIDEDNVVLAGNATIEAAAQAGIERVRVVEADGNEIIAVRRSGLSKREKKRLALFDNRVAELAEWEPDVLTDDKDLLAGLFSDNELQFITGQLGEPDDPRALWDDMPSLDGEARAYRAITVYIENKEAVDEFATHMSQKITEKTKSLWWPPQVKV